MNATTTDRSASELEREGEEIRASLDRTLDEIQHRLSPAELMDRSMEFVRENGMDLLREAGETVRRNPVPVLLTAAGLVWLTTSIASSRSNGGSSGRSYGGRSGEEHDLSDYRSQARSSYSRDDYDDNWDSSAHGRVRNAAQRVKSQVRGMKSQVTDRVSSSMHAMQNRTSQASSNFTNLVREQPVALGALALAAGALLGAALPMTRYENQLVGPVHDRTMARAKELGQREYQNIRDAVASRAQKERGSGQSGSDESRGAGPGNGSTTSSPG